MTLRWFGVTLRALRDFFEGGEVPRKEGQSDKARMKELRLVKRTADNEIGDLKEREQKRICMEKNASIAAVQQAAEIAQGSVEMVVGDIMDKDTLKAQYKAQMTVINQHEKAARTVERQAVQKAKGSTKGKAKGKAKGSTKGKTQSNAEEHDEEAMVDTAKDDQDANATDASEVGSLVQEPPPPRDVAGAVAAFAAGDIVAQDAAEAAEAPEAAEAAEDQKMNFSIEEGLEEMMDEEAAARAAASSSSEEWRSEAWHRAAAQVAAGIVF